MPAGFPTALPPSTIVRVGYVQSNFNADNCLVGGRTMDYGPFGFVERYERHWVMWNGGGQKFGFLNQPNAGAANFISFARALTPLLSDNGIDKLQEICKDHARVAQREVEDVWRRKLGLTTWQWNAGGEPVRPCCAGCLVLDDCS